MSTTPADPELRPTRPTMRDVAQLAGVSLKTVSRVVNEEGGVTPQLAQRVHDAVAQLGFRPNLTASHLRRTGGRTSTIGLVLENIANPYSSALHRAIEDACRPQSVALFAGSVDEDPERERDLVRAFVERRVDGMVIVPAGLDQSYLVEEMAAGVHVVFVDRPSSLADVDRVLVDNRGASRGAVEHLIAHGHRRIAFLGDLTSIHTARERHEGYRDAHLAHGLAVADHHVRHGLHDSDHAETAVAEMLTGDDPPTAIFASQNLVTVGAVRALRALGRSHEIALVGFDDFALAELVDPPVTVVAQNPTALGAAAADLLLRRIAGEAGPPHEVIVPTELIARGSGEIAPPGPDSA